MQERKTTIDVIKGISVLSVICAHCNSVSPTANSFTTICSIIISNIGTLGVVCFFVISGYLFHTSSSFFQFVKKKLFSLIIPWIIGSTVVYLYVYFRKPPMSWSGWLNFMLGNGSYFYYITVLLTLYVFFYLLPIVRSDTALTICVAVTVVSVSFDTFHNLVQPYLNPLNWIGFFSCGMLIKKHEKALLVICRKLYRIRWVPLLLYMTILCFQVIRGDRGSYWGMPNALFCWIGACAIAAMGATIKNNDSIIIRGITLAGKESFFFYIWHMPVAGVITNLMNRGLLCNLVVIRPLVILLLSLILYGFSSKVFELAHMKNCSYLIGIRGSRI